MASAVKHTAQEARVSIVNPPLTPERLRRWSSVRCYRPAANWPMPAASCGELRVWVYRPRPIACQTVTTATVHRIVTGAYTMLYRGMDRAQLDAAYNNSAAVPEREAIVAD